MLLLLAVLWVNLLTASGRNLSASLRGAQTVNKRALEPFREVHYDYIIDIEQEVEEGGAEDNDEGPPEATIICIEKSMATHMDRNAEAYFVEQKNYNPNPNWWVLEKIIYQNGHEEIIMVVKSIIMALLKLYEEGKLFQKEKVSLKDYHRGHRRVLATGNFMHGVAEIDVTHESSSGRNDKKFDLQSVHRDVQDVNVQKANAQKAKRKKRRKKKRKWKAKLKNLVKCKVCDPDDIDRRRAKEQKRSLELTMQVITFETWMSDLLRDEINTDCSQLMITNSSFYRLEDGSISEASDPSASGDEVMDTIDTSLLKGESHETTPLENPQSPQIISNTVETVDGGVGAGGSSHNANGADKNVPIMETASTNKLSEGSTQVKTETSTNAPTPAPHKSGVMCCSINRRTCMQSDYCNRSQHNCENKCNDFWINLPETEPTKEPTEVPTTIPTKTPTRMPTKKPTNEPTPAPQRSTKMCCSDDRRTCKTSEYCNRSQYNCEDRCNDFWINPTKPEPTNTPTTGPTGKPTNEPTPEALQRNTMCCSEDRKTCKASEYCNRSKYNCERRCNDLWINPPKSEKTTDPTTAPTEKPTNEPTTVSVQSTMCCSYDRRTCMKSEYCNRSQYSCENRCNDFWINGQKPTKEPVPPQSSTMCCSDDRRTCKTSEYCNRSKYNCENRCYDFWIKPKI